MRAPTLILALGCLLVAVGVVFGVRDWLGAQPPKVGIAIEMPDAVVAGTSYTVPVVFENQTRRRMRVVGWNLC